MSFNYIICAAGEGSRTASINPIIPKPLLKMDDRTFLEISLSSFRFSDSDNVYIIGQKNHNLRQANTEISKNLNISADRIRWIDIDSCTRGQLATALIGFEAAGSPDNIVIYNCDTFFEGYDLQSEMNNTDWEGLIPCSIEKGDSWSFCKVKQFDKNQIMETLQVEEKKRISDLCSVGLYFFRSGNLFSTNARQEINEQNNSECFIAPIYNRYIKRNVKVGTLLIQGFKAFGSNEQILQFWGKSLNEMQEQNRNNPYRKLA